MLVLNVFKQSRSYFVSIFLVFVGNCFAVIIVCTVKPLILVVKAMKLFDALNFGVVAC